MSNLEKTLSIIKPDAVERNLENEIKQIFENKGFRILKEKKIKIDKSEAEKFYKVHETKPFYDELTSFMSSGSCIVLALNKPDAVNEWRNLIGATNPAEASEGTIRKDFASSLGENAVHGADSDENARREVGFFFSEAEIISNH